MPERMFPDQGPGQRADTFSAAPVVADTVRAQLREDAARAVEVAVARGARPHPRVIEMRGRRGS